MNGDPTTPSARPSPAEVEVEVEAEVVAGDPCYRFSSSRGPLQPPDVADATTPPAAPTRADVRGDLAARQAALAAALVSGADPPPGFDTRRLGAARAALLRKRAGEVARHWPLLAAGLAGDWPTTFVRWAAARPPRGGLRDGWDLARELRATGGLPPMAAGELAVREAVDRYDGHRPPRPRRLPAAVRVGDAVAVQFAGRVRLHTRR